TCQPLNFRTTALYGGAERGLQPRTRSELSSVAQPRARRARSAIAAGRPVGPGAGPLKSTSAEAEAAHHGPHRASWIAGRASPHLAQQTRRLGRATAAPRERLGQCCPFQRLDLAAQVEVTGLHPAGDPGGGRQLFGASLAR